MVRPLGTTGRCARKENKNGRWKSNRRRKRRPNQLETRRLSIKTGLRAGLGKLSPAQRARLGMPSAIEASVSSLVTPAISVYESPARNRAGLREPGLSMLATHRRAKYSLPPPALGEGGHCTFAGRRVAVCRRAVFVVPERQRPHP
jgi:hypothetical protein